MADLLYADDYVVEQGTDGIWTYRKWASGIAECWRKVTQNISITTLWTGTTNMYVSNGGISVDFPFEFTEIPDIFYSVNSTPNSVIPIPSATPVATTKNSYGVQFARPMSAENVEVTIYWTVKGRWK